MDTLDAMEVIGQWKIEHGYVVEGRLTDLMGWVTYMFKAFGPETPFVWRKEGKIAKSGTVSGAVRRTGEASTAEEAGEQAELPEEDPEKGSRG